MEFYLKVFEQLERRLFKHYCRSVSFSIDIYAAVFRILAILKLRFD